jgi:hypothetical protein
VLNSSQLTANILTEICDDRFETFWSVKVASPQEIDLIMSMGSERVLLLGGVRHLTI